MPTFIRRGETIVSLKEMLLDGGGALLILLTVIQIAPIQINPWSAIGRALGRAINSSVLDKLDVLNKDQKETRQALQEHIRIDDERDADAHRQRILQFNNELLRDVPHTKEDFTEVLAEIDDYEKYCRDHPEYKNNRAVHAIAHIGKIYDERLEKHDFL